MLAEDPNKTSGRAMKSPDNLKFPLTENPAYTCKLRFVKYDRLVSMLTGVETNTAVITLPMPMGTPDTSSIKTGSTYDMGSFGNLKPEQLQKLLDGNFADAVSVGVTELTDKIQLGFSSIKENAVKGLALAPGISDNIRTKAEIMGGVITNPHTTLLFEGVNLKSFHLEWRLSPRTPEEARAIDAICKRIKYAAHPDEMLNGYALNYPDLCYVEFTGDAAKFLPKYQRAFISNLVVTPDAPAGAAFFKDGAPISTTIQISFTELNIVTRQVLDSQNV